MSVFTSNGHEHTHICERRAPWYEGRDVELEAVLRAPQKTENSKYQRIPCTMSPFEHCTIKNARMCAPFRSIPNDYSTTDRRPEKAAVRILQQPLSRDSHAYMHAIHMYICANTNRYACIQAAPSVTRHTPFFPFFFPQTQRSSSVMLYVSFIPGHDAYMHACMRSHLNTSTYT
jgi:hypothetical protein